MLKPFPELFFGKGSFLYIYSHFIIHNSCPLITNSSKNRAFVFLFKIKNYICESNITKKETAILVLIPQ